jgi:hypothetical protein
MHDVIISIAGGHGNILLFGNHRMTMKELGISSDDLNSYSSGIPEISGACTPLHISLK